jgi:hypothetical protein
MAERPDVVLFQDGEITVTPTRVIVGDTAHSLEGVVPVRSWEYTGVRPRWRRHPFLVGSFFLGLGIVGASAVLAELVHGELLKNAIGATGYLAGFVVLLATVVVMARKCAVPCSCLEVISPTGRRRFIALPGGRHRQASAAVVAAAHSAARPGWHCSLVRSWLGTPQCPVSLDRAWLTPAVVAVASTIAREQRYSDLPILADALEDAGCTDPIILEHCRAGVEHPGGCWVLDLMLGKPGRR